jgi:digeranylgeranylglycerophospholipid reductase
LYDVLVLGGGPTGSQTAYRLAAAGHNVAVVDQKNDLGSPICCTGIVGEECVRSFEIDESVVLRHVNSATVFSPAGKKMRLWRESAQAAILDRPAFNLFMSRRAKANGAEYLTGASVIDITVQPDNAQVTLRRDKGEIQVTARAVVIATGFTSQITERLGFSKHGNYVAGAQAEVQTNSVSEVEVYLGSRFAPGFFAWLVPTRPRQALAGLLSRQEPQACLARYLKYLVSEGKISSNAVTQYTGGVRLKSLTRTYADRILVVGTAAGQVKPTTGGGIYYGLLCADTAAKVMDDALCRDNLTQRSLAIYQHEWRGRLGYELKMGSWARKFYEHLDDGQIDRMFDIIHASGIVEALLKRDDVSFDWHSLPLWHLLGETTLARLIRGVKPPFRTKIHKDSSIPREEKKFD